MRAGRKRQFPDGRVISFYVPLSLARKLEKIAEKEKVSVSEIIRKSLQKTIENTAKENTAKAAG